MSAAQRQELWGRLASAALVEGEEPPALAPQPPWFVRVMLGFAGWFGALFLLGFGGLVLSFLFESVAGSLSTGVVLCGGAAFLFRKSENDFLTQLGFAVSLAGQAAILIGFGQLFEEHLAATAVALALVQAALFFLAPSFLHRVWTAWTGALALAVALGSWEAAAFVPPLLTAAFAWIWLEELDHPRRNEILRAGGYGLTLAAVVMIFFLEALSTTVMWTELGPQVPPIFGAALTAGILIVAVLRLLSREGVGAGTGPGRAALVGAVILGLASLAAPGLAPAVLILVLGHANGNRLLTGLGILVLLGYLSYYYYSLEMTLLEKSALLAAVGVALLLARLALHRWWPEPAAEEVPHA